MKSAVEKGNRSDHVMHHQYRLNRWLSICRMTVHDEKIDSPTSCHSEPGGKPGGEPAFASALMASRLRPPPRSPHPFDLAELQIPHIALRQRTPGFVKLPGQRPAANPVPGCILLQNCSVKWIHAVQLEDHTAVQQAVTIHRGDFTS
jgi:hypothetical protein